MGDKPGTAYVERCRSDVHAEVAALLRPCAIGDLELALHRSVSRLLHEQFERLRRSTTRLDVLPQHLRADFLAWSEALRAEDIERIVRFRASRWRDTMLELMHRLAADWAALVDCFGLSPSAALCAVSEPLGDVHNDGRFVCRLTFDDGQSVIYKPRSIEAEQLFGRVVRWMCSRGCDPALRSCRTLARRGYGWMEYVERSPCTTDVESLRYYMRQGNFLAIFYLMCGGDCNFENVIIHGEHPIWIDTECLCLPDLVNREEVIVVPPWMRDSILTTQFVFYPNLHGIPPRKFTALSLNCFISGRTVFAQDGILQDCYISKVVRGFTDAYELILSHRKSWLSEGGPVSWGSTGRSRTIAKPTQMYAVLGDLLLITPEDANSRIREAVRETLSQRGDPVEWPDDAIDAEMVALDNGDVPYWSTLGRSRDLREGERTVVRNLAVRSGLECVKERVSRMGQQDLANQAWLIETFLKLPMSNEPTNIPSARSHNQSTADG